MKVIVALFLISTSATTYAQQDIISTTFWNNYAHVNPAMSALEYKKHGAFSFRKENAALSTDYTSILANYNFRLAEKHGIGVNFDYENGFSAKVSDFHLNYNYQLRFSPDRVLTIGAALGVTINKFHEAFVTSLLASDSTLQIAEKTTYFSPDVGVAYNSGNFMFGAGVTNLLEGEVSSKEEGEVSFSPARQLYLNAHYKIKFGKKKNLEIRPQVMYRTDFGFRALDANVLATFKNKYWAGFTYRNNDAYAFMIGWDIKEKLRVGYSFDMVQSKLTNASQRAHEINLGIFLK